MIKQKIISSSIEEVEQTLKKYIDCFITIDNEIGVIDVWERTDYTLVQSEEWLSFLEKEWEVKIREVSCTMHDCKFIFFLEENYV